MACLLWANAFVEMELLMTSPRIDDQCRWRGLPLPGSLRFGDYVRMIRFALPQLSPKHAAVALGMWAGLANKEIGDWLLLSPSAVSARLRGVYIRLGDLHVSRNADVVRLVERTFLVLAGSCAGSEGRGNSSSVAARPRRPEQGTLR